MPLIDFWLNNFFASGFTFVVRGGASLNDATLAACAKTVGA